MYRERGCNEERERRVEDEMIREEEKRRGKGKEEEISREEGTGVVKDQEEKL